MYRYVYKGTYPNVHTVVGTTAILNGRPFQPLGGPLS
jgi:hypothetical protein